VSNPGEQGGFFAELKRRNVFRVAVAYLVAAWLLLQVADIVLDNINAPEWVIQVFMLALVVGLPVALIFAWAFEMTPEGIKREKDVDRSQSITHHTGRKLDRVIIGILALAVVVLVIDRVRHAQHDETPVATDTAEAQPVSAAPSIAVLPFVNMSSDPEQEYFSDGISEEILNSLAKVKELKVAGRTSSFAFKGQNQDLRQIGDTLGVEHILEGSVRKAGATVRITAQLIQVNDGFHLWSETYDRELTDVFAIQDEIANAILEQLKAHLVGVEVTSTLASTERTDSEVYDLYLLARQRIYERKGPSLLAAADLLDRAIARDQQYAPAYALRGIAALLLSEGNYGTTPITESWSQSKLYIDRALQLEPELAEGWAALGLYHNNRPGEHREAIEALEKALAINPNLIDASNWLHITYGEIGESLRALEIQEEIIERDPLYPPSITNTVISYSEFGQYEKAWSFLDRVRPFMPGDPQLMQAEAIIWLYLGQPSRALSLLEPGHVAQPDDATMKAWWSFSLMETRQYERILSEQGAPAVQVIAMDLTGRSEEAGMLAAKLAADGDIGPLLHHLYRTEQFAELAKFTESGWADLAAFEDEFPARRFGHELMLDVAGAYARLGNATRFEDAMSRIRAAHDRILQQNDKNPRLQLSEGRYYALSGDADRAIEHLERAVDLHLLRPTALHELWPDLAMLRGDPRYEALLARMEEQIANERASLGLEPLST